MNRVVSLLLGLNSFTILERKTLTANDRNLQYMNIKLDDEIDIEDYSLLIRYKQVDGKIFADVYSIEKENDIQIPNSILEFPQTLTIEFCYISNKDNNRITIPRKLQLNVVDTYDTIIEPDDVVVGASVADIVKEIPKKTEEGKAEIEKSKDEAIEELKKHSDSNVEESKEQINSFTSQKQEQLDTYTKTKESQLDEYTLLKQGDMDSYTSTKKNDLDTYEKIKEKQIDDYVSDISKPSLDKYVKEKNIELDLYTGKKKSELDVYEKAKEGKLDSYTNTKKEELNQHTVQKQGQLDEYTTAKKGELDSHTTQKKNELNTHGKAKEKELDNYVTTVNKPELDKYTNIKKEELNSHTKTKESEITQVTETKKQEITAHGASELGKFGQGAKQEADKQIGRVVSEGDVQVQRVKDESNGVIPRIEKLESGKVSKSGDTMTGALSFVGNSSEAQFYGYKESDKDLNNLIPFRHAGWSYSTWSTKNDIKNGFNMENNANSVLSYSTYDGSHGHQIGLSSDGNLYHRILRVGNNFSKWGKIYTENNLNTGSKADLTGSTFTGLVAVKKDTNGEAMVALNSAYGNGDIYSGGSAKGVGFKNRTSGAGIFLDDTNDITVSSSKLFIKDNQLVYRNTGSTAQYIPHVKTFRVHSTSIVGLIKISFKNGFDSTMMNFVVNVFNYQGASGKVYISGYNYGTDKIWAYCDSNMIYNDNSIERAVYFGKENDIPVIYIGNKNDTYEYPTITIGEMMINSRVDSKNVLDNIDIEIVNDFNSDFIMQITKKTSTLNNNNIIDNLLSTDKYKPLSAKQGKRLNDEKLDKSSVVNNLTTGGADKPLSAEQGKLLKQEIDNLTNEIGQLKQQIAEMQNK